MPGVVSSLRRKRPVRRVAMVSMHTSPQDQPGGGDAGGMNVYVAELARRLPELGVEVDVFTRATSSEARPVVPFAPGVTLRHIAAGPFEGLPKGELPSQLCTFLAGVLREEAAHELGHYDLVHSHYWLSGQVGMVAAERFGVPLVHAAHTLAKVKNAALAAGDTPEPQGRVIGEEQVVAAADRLIAATPDEARQLQELYAADASRIVTIAPGVDLEVFRPGDATLARRSLGIPPDSVVLTFVGRLQPLKGPDVLLRAAAELVRRDPGLVRRLVVLVVGATSGGATALPAENADVVDTASSLRQLAHHLGLQDQVRFLPPQPRRALAEVYRASQIVAVPSHNESFGLVALEAAACGIPVVATQVGGLPTAVGPAGLLVRGHTDTAWATAIERALAVRPQLSRAARPHAQNFSWSTTATATVAAYTECLAERQARVAGMIGA